MADPKVLYAVVSVVFAGLMVWLVFVFRTVKEPWAVAPRPVAAAAPKTEPAAPVEDSGADVENVTVKNEAATEEAIEKAKKG